MKINNIKKKGWQYYCPKCNTELIEVMELSYPRPQLEKYICPRCGYVKRDY